MSIIMVAQHRRSFAIALLFLLYSPTPSLIAQENVKASDRRQIELETEKKSLALLDDVLSDAQGLKLIQNRIFIQMSAVELLWLRDEKRARAIFEEATSNLAELIRSVDASDEQNSFLLNANNFLRQNMFRIAAARDAELALRFLRATRRPPLLTETGYKIPDDESQLEQALSVQVAANDPKRALQIAEKSLENGFSYELTNLLVKLREKDSEAATTLTKEILSKLRSQNLVSNEQARYVALNILDTALRSGADVASGESNQSQARKTSPILDAQATRDLLDIVMTAALNASPGTLAATPDQFEKAKNFLWSLRFMRRGIEKYDPARASALKAKLGEFNKTLDADNRMRGEFFDQLQDNNVDAALEIVDKAPSNARDMLYYEASGQIIQNGDIERGRQIVNRISNAGWRAQALAEVDRRMMVEAAVGGKLDKARQLLAQIHGKESRVTALVQLSATLAKKGDKKLAFQLLDEAQDSVKGQTESLAQLSSQFEIAQAYALLGSDKSFDAIEPLIPQLNDIIGATIVLDKFDRRMFVKENELVLPQSHMLFNGAYNRFTEGFSSLARVNFDRAKSAADKLARSETQALARLRVVQGILSEKHE